MFVWAKIPEGETSAGFAEKVLEEANVIVAPGNAYGPSGEGYVRISLATPDARLREAISRIESTL
jgi:LL-diaminopimelate aminotransferase